MVSTLPDIVSNTALLMNNPTYAQMYHNEVSAITMQCLSCMKFSVTFNDTYSDLNLEIGK